VTGLIAVSSAFALLAPRVAVFGALALVPTMVDAAVHRPLVALPLAVLVAGSALVLWARGHELRIPKAAR
jgi:hypothetical protein